MSKMMPDPDWDKIGQLVDSLTPDQEEALHKAFQSIINVMKPVMSSAVQIVMSILDETQQKLLVEATAEKERGE